VYVFGGVSVVVDTARESIRALIDGDWTPVSLDQLLDRARAIKR
jgi:2-(3-amino-3-carboxypropyl)histidine synthase/tuftelin-interacting protein 11